jgi:hypothetical protein
MSPSIRFTLSLLLAAPAILRADTAPTPAISGSFTAGVDSRYVLYGYRLDRPLYRGDLYLSRPVSPSLTLWGGSWYGYLQDGSYNELDLYTGADWAAAENTTLGAGYTLFNYLEVPFSDDPINSEFTAYIIRSIGPVSLTLRDHIDLAADGQLLRGIAGYSRPLVAAIDMKIDAEAGYGLRYYSDVNGWQYAQFKFSLSRPITESLGVTVFIARSLALETLEDFEEDNTFWGGSVIWSF